MAQPKSFKQLMQELQEYLKVACEGSTGGVKDGEVIARLRSVLLSLLDACAAKSLDTRTVLTVATFTLSQLPSAFTAGHESIFLLSFLRVAISEAQALHSDGLTPLVKLAARMASLCRQDHHLVLQHLFMGACELLMDAEHRLLVLSLPHTSLPSSSQAAAGQRGVGRPEGDPNIWDVPVFVGLSQWHMRWTKQQAGVGDGEAAALQQTTRDPDAYPADLTMKMKDAAAAQRAVHVGGLLLCQMLYAHPLLMASITPAGLLPTLLQLTALTEGATQAVCWQVLDALVCCVGHPLIQVEDVCSMAEWALQAWTTNTLDVAWPDLPAWSAHICNLTASCTSALHSLGVLQLHAAHTVETLVSAAIKAVNQGVAEVQTTMNTPDQQQHGRLGAAASEAQPASPADRLSVWVRFAAGLLDCLLGVLAMVPDAAQAAVRVVGLINTITNLQSASAIHCSSVNESIGSGTNGGSGAAKPGPSAAPGASKVKSEQGGAGGTAAALTHLLTASCQVLDAVVLWMQAAEWPGCLAYELACLPALQPLILALQPVHQPAGDATPLGSQGAPGGSRTAKHTLNDLDDDEIVFIGERAPDEAAPVRKKRKTTTMRQTQITFTQEPPGAAKSDGPSRAGSVDGRAGAGNDEHDVHGSTAAEHAAAWQQRAWQQLYQHRLAHPSTAASAHTLVQSLLSLKYGPAGGNTADPEARQPAGLPDHQRPCQAACASMTALALHWAVLGPSCTSELCVLFMHVGSTWLGCDTGAVVAQAAKPTAAAADTSSTTTSDAEWHVMLLLAKLRLAVVGLGVTSSRAAATSRPGPGTTQPNALLQAHFHHLEGSYAAAASAVHVISQLPSSTRGVAELRALCGFVAAGVALLGAVLPGTQHRGKLSGTHTGSDWDFTYQCIGLTAKAQALSHQMLSAGGEPVGQGRENPAGVLAALLAQGTMQLACMQQHCKAGVAGGDAACDPRDPGVVLFARSATASLLTRPGDASTDAVHMACVRALQAVVHVCSTSCTPRDSGAAFAVLSYWHASRMPSLDVLQYTETFQHVMGLLYDSSTVGQDSETTKVHRGTGSSQDLLQIEAALPADPSPAVVTPAGLLDPAWWPHVTDMERVLEPILFQHFPKDASLAAAVLGLHVMHVYLQHVPGTMLVGGKKLLKKLLRLLGSSQRAICQGLVMLLHSYLRPAVLFEAFGPGAMHAPSSATTTATLDAATLDELHACEQKLMGELHQLLDVQELPMAARIGVLHTAANLFDGIHASRDPSATITPLLLLVGCLGRDEPELRAAAWALLDTICERHNESLETLLIHSPSARGVLEYVGKNVVDQPRLIFELSQRLQIEEPQLVMNIMPHVIGWLCTHRKLTELQRLAEFLGYDEQLLFARYAPQAIAYACWVEATQFQAFMDFTDALMKTQNDGIVHVMQMNARDIAEQVILTSGQAHHWSGTDVPATVISRASEFINGLAEAAGEPDRPEGSDLLVGHKMHTLLKSFGASFKDTATTTTTTAPNNPEHIPAARSRVASSSHVHLVAGAGHVQALEARQLQNLRSMCVLLTLLGRHVSNHMYHVMAVLTAALRCAPSQVIQMQALACWRLWVHALAREAPNNLARIVVQATVVLLSQLTGDEGPVQSMAVAVLEDMVLVYKEHTKDVLKLMPTLPSYSALAKVNAALQRESVGAAQLGKHMRMLTSNLQHENVVVRYTALGELRAFITRNRKWVSSIVYQAVGIDKPPQSSSKGDQLADALNTLMDLNSEGAGKATGRVQVDAAHIIRNMLSALLHSTGNVVRINLIGNLRERCAECLGLLGPVDPARVSVPAPSVEGLHDVGEQGVSLARTVITKHLIRMLTTTSDIVTLEFTSYALQVILQHYSDAADKSKVAAAGGAAKPPKPTKLAESGLYSSLSPEHQAILQPFLTSKYIIQTVRDGTTDGGADGTASNSNTGGAAGAAAGQLGDRAASSDGRPAGSSLSRAQSDGGSVISGGLVGGGDAGARVYVPLISHRPPHSFRRWLELWLRSMISQTRGPAHPVFVALSGALKFDLPLIMFILPFVVHNIITLGDAEAVAAIKCEITTLLAVATQQLPGSPQQPSAAARQPPGDATSRGKAGLVLEKAVPDRPLDRTVSHQPPETVPELELHLQAVFTLLDVLSRWVRDGLGGAAAAELAGNSTSRSSSKQASSTSGRAASGAGDSRTAAAAAVKAVSRFIQSVPRNDMAHAASRCGAHARALLYYESWAREVQGGGLNPAAYKSSIQYSSSQVSFLLEVYGQLEEPDGIAGLIQLRSGGLTPSDAILAAEKAGQWSESLGMYEQLLSRRPTGDTWGPGQQVPSPERLGLQQGALRALLQLGHLQAVIHQVDGLLARLPGDARAAPARAQVAAAGVAAAWRMGNWALLEEYLPLAQQGLSPSTRDGSSRQEAGTAVYAPSPIPTATSSSGGGGGGGGSLGVPVQLSAQDEWEIRVGGLLLNLQSGRYASVDMGLAASRRELMSLLPALSAESYSRAYPLLAKLGMLQEVQDVSQLLQDMDKPGTNSLDTATFKRKVRWQERSAVAQSSLSIQEAQLSLRRQLAGLVGQHGDAVMCRLQYAELCRRTGHHEAAEAAVLEAVGAGAPGAVLERAKLLWHSGRERRALAELSRELNKRSSSGLPSVTSSSSPSARLQHAQLALQLAKWTAIQGQQSYAELKGLFQAAINMEPKWEKPYFQYARYLDRLYQDVKKRQTSTLTKSHQGNSRFDRLGGRSKLQLGEEFLYFEYLPDVISNYGRCVEMGYRHAQQCLPRVITLYCEFGSDQQARQGKAQTVKERTAATQVINKMKELSRNIPPVAWLLTLPQIISRICHTYFDVSEVLQGILARCLESFTQHTLWSVACLMRSSSAARRTVAQSLLAVARGAQIPGVPLLISNFQSLTDGIMKFSMWSLGFKQLPSVKKLYPTEYPQIREFQNILPKCGVMVPAQEAFTIVLPPVPLSPSSSKAAALTANQPAAVDNCVTIKGMRDEVWLMSSLQRPKRIVLIGSDGHEYPFLAKPKDDLRKDYRLMDLASVANKMFAANSASRRRGLRLRTYAVIVLTEDCGMLQWLNNLTAFKSICEDTYVQSGVITDRKEFTNWVRKKYESWPTDGSRSKLMDEVLEKLPPRMHQWWLTRYPEPASWLQARLAFTRSNATWCMTGHMLGLGDRHGENITIDTNSGETVHVDFGCLFDRGLILEVPERVPFRMTQNMVDCFGVAGVEGAFRKAAENTLEVLRQHRGTLMTCAETFLYDPLVDWARRKGEGPTQAEGEYENPGAKDALATLEGRLQGTLLGVTSLPSLPLSVEGQAARLIAEAMDKENLGRMYIWWMPWF